MARLAGYGLMLESVYSGKAMAALEREIAEWLEVPRALLFDSGLLLALGMLCAAALSAGFWWCSQFRSKSTEASA